MLQVAAGKRMSGELCLLLAAKDSAVPLKDFSVFDFNKKPFNT